MRLGQLARKLSLRPSQIIEFLAQQNIRIDEGSNTRMEDDHVVMVVQKYAPDNLGNIVAEIDEVEESEGESVEIDQPVVEAPIPQIEVAEEQPVAEPEVIRVPKIELSGLKVLGKIELPEPKKKEPVGEQTEPTEPTIIAEETPKPTVKAQKVKGKPTQHKREQSKPREWKNPLELKREREAREAEEKRRAAIEREKEKRKKYYEEKVKAVAQPKRVKPVKEQPQEKNNTVSKPEPKTILGKFLRWLNT